MTTQYRWPHAVATAIAVSAVGYQTAVILEMMPDVSTTTKLGVPLATISAALLPVLAEAAWRSGERVKACLLALPVLVLMAYVLPSGVSRLGEQQQARVATATLSEAATAQAKADLAKAEKLVSEAQAWVAGECKTGNGKRCEGVTFVLNQRQAFVRELQGKLSTSAQVVAPWMPTWQPALLPIGLELAIIFAMFFGMGPLTHSVQALTFERDLTPAEIAEIKRIQRLTPENVKTLKGLGMKYHEIAGHFGINQGRISEMMAGKREAITLH